MDKAAQRATLERFGQFLDRTYRVGPGMRQSFEFVVTVPSDLAAGIIPGDTFTLSGPIRESEAQPDLIVGQADKVLMTVIGIQHLSDGHKVLRLLPSALPHIP